MLFKKFKSKMICFFIGGMVIRHRNVLQVKELEVSY